MRIVLFCEHVDWDDFADEVAPGEDSQELEFSDLAEARKVWDVIAYDWANGNTGWFVSDINVYDDAGNRHCLFVEDDFPGDFDAIVEACIAGND